MSGLGCRLDAAMARWIGGGRRLGEASDRFVDVKGSRVRVRDVGEGPLAVVFAPDPPNVLEHHDEAFAALSKHVRVVGLELPGFGFSTPSPGFGFSIHENRDVLLEVLDRLGVERAVLALSCVAGLVSVAAAVHRPQRVAGVVGVQSADFAGALAWSRRVDARGLIRTPVLGQMLVRWNRRPLARQWYRAASGDPRWIEPFAGKALRAYDQGAVYSLASALQGLSRLDPGEVLGTVEALPAAAIWGQRDRTHRKTDRAALARYLPRLTVVEIDEAGHFPELEAEDRFRVELLRWMEGSGLW